MELVRTKAEVRREVARARARGLSVGLVPTMGYFHEGHLELMRLCRRRAGYAAVSLFVNPTQFAPEEDLERYPRDEDRDRGLAGAEGVDLLFAPPADEMYAADRSTFVEETSLSRGLCGAARPGHFRGVTTVVAKLFNIFQPDFAVFGRKDLQQLQVIRRMARDLDFPVEVVEGPAVREPDGLAMSSRNAYLTGPQREAAPGLYRALADVAGRIARGDVNVQQELDRARRTAGESTGGEVEYLSALDGDLAHCTDPERIRYVAAALVLGETRLIDNVAVPPGDPVIPESRQ